MPDGFNLDDDNWVNEERNRLCCCEYYSDRGVRTHLITLCCNCEPIDRAFDRLISCQSIPISLVEEMRKTISDRLRYPFCDGNGARRVNYETVLPPLILTALLLISTFGPIATLISLFVLLPSLLYSTTKYYHDFDYLRQTQFFLSWSITSAIGLICVFEIEVVPYLEILLIENVILIILMALAVIMAIILRGQSSESPLTSGANEVYNYWIRAAIMTGTRYYFLYIIALIVVSMALLYGAQLTISTICHSSPVFEKVLIPDDCNEVYLDIHLGICFVSALYALEIAFCVVFTLIFKLWYYFCQRSFRTYMQLKREDY